MPVLPGTRKAVMPKSAVARIMASSRMRTYQPTSRLILSKIQDGIADDLARAVVGDVSAAIGGVEFDVFLAKDMFGSEEISAVSVAAERDNVGMFAKEKDVVDSVGFSRGDKALLQGVGIRCRRSGPGR